MNAIGSMRQANRVRPEADDHERVTSERCVGWDWSERGRQLQNPDGVLVLGACGASKFNARAFKRHPSQRSVLFAMLRVREGCAVDFREGLVDDSQIWRT